MALDVFVLVRTIFWGLPAIDTRSADVEELGEILRQPGPGVVLPDDDAAGGRRGEVRVEGGLEAGPAVGWRVRIARKPSRPKRHVAVARQGYPHRRILPEQEKIRLKKLDDAGAVRRELESDAGSTGFVVSNLHANL